MEHARTLTVPTPAYVQMDGMVSTVALVMLLLVLFMLITYRNLLAQLKNDGERLNGINVMTQEL